MLDCISYQLDSSEPLNHRLAILEKRLEVQCHLSQLLAQAETLEIAIEGTFKILCEGFNWRFGEYWSRSEGGQELQRQHFWILPGLGVEIDEQESIAEFSCGEGLPGQIWAKNMPLYFKNLVDNPSFLRQEFAQNLSLRHGYGFPISNRVQLVGVITFFTQENQVLDDELINLLQLFGEQLGLFIQRKSAELKLRDYAARLESTLKELKQTQAQMIHTEKMSSLGQLVAGIAHEINNPVNFIHGNLTPAQEYYQHFTDLLLLYEQHYPNPHTAIAQKREDLDIEFLKQDFGKLLQSMKIGTNRIQEIVLSLRNFSRLDETGLKTADLHIGIDSTLLILQNRLKAHTNVQTGKRKSAITIIKNYGQLSPIECYAGQINQVFMNIFNNAIDALRSPELSLSEERSLKITIDTENIERDRRPWIRITVSDNGIGIPESIQDKIFNPFFTTKPVGQGQGLGLAINYKIITERHGGRFYFRSKLGEGSQFILELPA
jgi:signal transduction histidine kinase